MHCRCYFPLIIEVEGFLLVVQIEVLFSLMGLLYPELENREFFRQTHLDVRSQTWHPKADYWFPWTHRVGRLRQHAKCAPLLVRQSCQYRSLRTRTETATHKSSEGGLESDSSQRSTKPSRKEASKHIVGTDRCVLVSTVSAPKQAIPPKPNGPRKPKLRLGFWKFFEWHGLQRQLPVAQSPSGHRIIAWEDAFGPRHLSHGQVGKRGLRARKAGFPV